MLETIAVIALIIYLSPVIGTVVIRTISAVSDPDKRHIPFALGVSILIILFFGSSAP